MNFTRENLVQIWGVLNGLKEMKTTAKGAYGISKNKGIVTIEIEAIEEAQKNKEVPEEIKEFEKERIALCQELADKDEDDQPVVNGNEFQILENRPAFNEKLAELHAKYKEALDTIKKQDETFKEFLKEEIEINFHTIKIDDIPNDVTAQQLEILDKIIID